MEEGIIVAAKDYISDLFKNNSDGHDADHSLRVYQNACRIAEGYPNSNRMIIYNYEVDNEEVV